jgi:Fungal Zn(2)-Cys(6) binuclear cluster domain
VARDQSLLPKIETRRACDRCKKFKSRCSGGIPCERCRQASHVCTVSKVSRQSETIPELSHDDRSPTTTSTISAASQLGEDNSMLKESLDESKQFPSDFPSFSSLVQQTPSQEQSLPSNPGYDSLDWNFFYSTLQDMAEPASLQNPDPPTDFNFDLWNVGFPGMVESFSPQTAVDETKLDWEFDGFSLSQLDPFEAHRMKIVDYLRNQCQVGSCQLAYLSTSNTKTYFHAYITRFHYHSPFLHMPTFDITKISTSLYFSMLILGALHCGQSDMDEVMRALWPYAETYVWSNATVVLFIRLIVGSSTWQCQSCGHHASALFTLRFQYILNARTRRSSHL